jgi:hypothetical protein
MAYTRTTIAHERVDRGAEIEQALASVRLEGLEPGDAAKAIFQRYVDGELSLEQIGMEIRALHDREHGPLHVSRDQRP